MASIFTKIINGEIPCYKIAEDERYIAFLDIVEFFLDEFFLQRFQFFNKKYTFDVVVFVLNDSCIEAIKGFCVFGEIFVVVFNGDIRLSHDVSTYKRDAKATFFVGPFFT